MKLRRDCDLYQEKKEDFAKIWVKSDLYHLFRARRTDTAQ